MPKGVEKVRVVGYSNSPFMDWVLSKKPNEYPSKFNFEGPKGAQLEAEYYAETPQQDRGRAKWIVEEASQGPFDKNYKPKDVGDKIKIDVEPKYCGKVPMVVEAYMNTPENQYPTRLEFTAWSTQKVTDAKWSKTTIKSGENATLTLNTEGLNGYRLDIHVFNEAWREDELAAKYSKVVSGGEIILEARDTFNWRKANGMWQEGEETYYIKARLKGSKSYLKVNGSEEDFGKIKVKKTIVSREVLPPSSPKPLLVGQTEVNLERYEPCGFKALTFVDEGKDILLFEEGSLKLKKNERKEFQFEGKIHFDFDKYHIRKNDAKVLDKIAEFLNNNPYIPAELGAHCDIRGDHAYNFKLSNNRAAASLSYLEKKGISKKRLSAKGYGKTRLIHQGENIPEELHEENRRLTVRFKVKGSDAQTIDFNVIAGDENLKPKKKLTLKIDDFEGTDKCFKKGTNLEHSTNVIIIDPKNKESNHDGKSDVVKEIYGPEPAMTIAPLDFIWPHKVMPNQYKYHIHTCRYYTIKDKPTINVNVYPDIKWDFHFFLNLSNSLSVTWQKLGHAKHEEMRKKSGKIGAEKRFEQTDIDFGVVLQAQWNKISDNKYQDKEELTLKFQAKIKQLYSVFAKLKEASKIISGKTKAKAVKTVGKKFPLGVEVLPPNFCLGAEWQLSRGYKKGKPTQDLGTLIEFYFKAKPLIGIELTLDLLQAAIGATGPAAPILSAIRYWLQDSETSNVTVDLYIDLVVFGTIDIPKASFKYNTASDDTDPERKSELEASATIGLKLKAGLIVKAKAVIIVAEFYAQAYAKFEGKGSITFGHQIKYLSDKLYYRPKLMFDGLHAKVEIKAEIGLLIKKGWFQGDYKKDLKDFNREFKNIIEPFDIIKSIEKLTGKSADVILID